jgi:cytochrome b subunit of formate dehydrogenase
MNRPNRYLRFSLLRRIEHWLQTASFTLLAVTGLPQRYIDSPISQALITWLGGIESVRIIHRISAVVLMLLVVYHLGAALYHWIVNRGRLTMLPSIVDLRAGWQTLRYNLGRIKDKPKQGFYTFEEKLEYWGLVWGTIIMILTGFFLWNPITAARFLPGEWIPAAKAAHGGEALLAVLFILTWHFYHVLIRHYNPSMFTGYLSRKDMQKFHPLVVEDGTGQVSSPKSEKGYQRRRRAFFITYGIFAIIMLGSIYLFVAAEQTAQSPEVIPDLQGIEIYSPLVPTPFPDNVSPLAVYQGETWDEPIGEMHASRCGDCHNPQNAQSNLDLTSYQGALRGGDSGAAIIPGASGVSLSIVWQSSHDHPGVWSPLEIAIIRAWIDSNAPEN